MTNGMCFPMVNTSSFIVGYLAGFREGSNILIFAPEFLNNPLRPTFSLVTWPDFPNAKNKIDIPWKVIKPQLADTLGKARTLWPKVLTDLPMDDVQKSQLKEHWRRL